MGDLEATLATVRDRIGKYRGQVIGESNTKSVLIEPVLRALGWDVEDLDEVRRECRRKPSHKRRIRRPDTPFAPARSWPGLPAQIGRASCRERV